MSSFHHPNIARFIGICLHSTCQLPVLVTERLEGDLHDLLVTVPNIPLVLKQSMLKDVASGLAYLHPQIVHRDLTAKNVLLTPSFMAKISDFGNCLTSDLSARFQGLLTPYPGQCEYMPPEVFTDPPCYNSSLDIFSFGHLVLFVMIQVTVTVLHNQQHLIYCVFRCFLTLSLDILILHTALKWSAVGSTSSNLKVKDNITN